MPRPSIGVKSSNAENEGHDRDPIVKLPRARKIRLRPRLGAARLRLAEHPRAQEIMAYTAKNMEKWDINIALLGQHKYMVANCLGLKVSAGEFSLKFGNSAFRFVRNGIELTFSIKRISLNALTLRMRPNLSNLTNSCTFGGRFTVGGSASDIKITIRYDPQIDLDECRLMSLGDVDIKVRIGGLNLKPLPTILDKVAKNMIEDAITYSLEVFTPDKIIQRTTGFPGGLCASKLFFYRRYMEQVAAGVVMNRLPEDYVNKLKDHYPNADLKKVLVGHSDRQVGIAITDCTRIYFKSKSMLDKTRYQRFSSKNDSGFLDLLHELRHVEQCSELGGREAYAERWFRDQEYAILLKLLDPTSSVNIHDLMPMEEDADGRAYEIVNDPSFTL